MVIDGKASVITVDYVSGNFYSLLGVELLAGRIFTPADDVKGAPAVAIISYEYWRERFGLDPSVVGKTVQLKDIACTIIGINRPGFRGLRTGGSVASITIPAQWHSHLTSEGQHHLCPFWALIERCDSKAGRSRFGPYLPPVADPLCQDGERSTRSERRCCGKQSSFRLRDRGHSNLIGASSFSSGWWRAVVALVLVIACMNLANLLLARGASRSREIAVRLALGARRSRIIRQLLTENLLLAIFGGALGLALSVPLMRLFTLILRGKPNARGAWNRDGCTVFRLRRSYRSLAAFSSGWFQRYARRTDGISSGLHGTACGNRDHACDRGACLLCRRWPSRWRPDSYRSAAPQPRASSRSRSGVLTNIIFCRSGCMPTLSGYEDQRELDLYDRVLVRHPQHVPGVRAASLSRLTLRHRGRRHGLAIDGAVNADAQFVFNTTAPGFFETLRLPSFDGKGLYAAG